MESAHRRNIFILVVLILTGYLLRLYNLGFACFWTEEEYSALMSLRDPLQIYFTVISAEFNPPGFYFLEYLSRVLLGYNEWSLRIPSLIAGVLLIPAMYCVGREFKDEITGLLCASLVASSYALVYYSQFARAYSLSLLFFSLSLLYYLKIRKGDTHYHHYIFLGIFIGLSAWVHFYSLIPLSLLVLILLIKDPAFRDSRRGYHTVCVAAVITLPLLPQLFTLIQGRVFAPGAAPYGLSAHDLLFILPIEFFSSAHLVFALLIMVGIYIEWKRPYLNELLVIGVVTVIIGLLASAVTPIYARYLLYVLLILFLASASFLSEVLKGKSDLVIIISVLLFTTVILAMCSGDFISHYTIQQYVCSYLQG